MISGASNDAIRLRSFQLSALSFLLPLARRNLITANRESPNPLGFIFSGRIALPAWTVEVHIDRSAVTAAASCRTSPRERSRSPVSTAGPKTRAPCECRSRCRIESPACHTPRPCRALPGKKYRYSRRRQLAHRRVLASQPVDAKQLQLVTLGMIAKQLVRPV